MAASQNDNPSNSSLKSLSRGQAIARALDITDRGAGRDTPVRIACLLDAVIAELEEVCPGFKFTSVLKRMDAAMKNVAELKRHLQQQRAEQGIRDAQALGQMLDRAVPDAIASQVSGASIAEAAGVGAVADLVPAESL